MNNLTIDIGNINDIIKKIIQQISNSRKQILEIVDNVRIEYENQKSELLLIRANIDKVIKEVDTLEAQDKLMRKKLVEISKKFNAYNEDEIKSVYESASDIRVKFIIKQNDERQLRERRNTLETVLKKSIKNIDNSEKIINQISIAMGYLEGDILSVLEGADKSSEMFIGIKILEAQENERKRISRDIHDGPAQHIASIIMKADICKKVIQKDLDEGLKELSDLKESVKVALKEIRSIIFDLRPMTLDDLGLNKTIEQAVKSISEDFSMDIKLKLKPMEIEVESIIQVAVFRIIQEILNNIKKHSKAKHLEVKLDFGAKYLSLIISDDGIGFDVEETLKRVKTKGTSYGLIGILDRVNQLQGQIHIKSWAGAGCVYNVLLPVNREVIRDGEKGH
ncbi:sensor histidine kinase [Clostridium tagluense]|uniref:sensor histidine kinase n=1 Tax=Clostridium tagluense TaxID=360422 RepID=UPI001CF44F67|nr:sensor histidine kinase [Clostridium tagluense]MCB2309562.1 sensor histidine kinase [Clostridium tagluense]MCB2314908.1 sensor histidine kinase [Clostridium tagluense]MCB2319757.1 sensor histidine kinase [Clostridium tagluense]MCB2324156.1 sensor histidine kinase [Clostridium tagluense]MCB2329007.1 sensor histidine kinase [Clostridium tagluense]